MATKEELRAATDDALEHQLLDAKDALFKARFQHATGQLDNSALLGRLKRDVARISTLLREREIAAAESQE